MTEVGLTLLHINLQNWSPGSHLYTFVGKILPNSINCPTNSKTFLFLNESHPATAHHPDAYRPDDWTKIINVSVLHCSRKREREKKNPHFVFLCSIHDVNDPLWTLEHCTCNYQLGWQRGSWGPSRNAPTTVAPRCPWARCMNRGACITSAVCKWI